MRTKDPKPKVKQELTLEMHMQPQVLTIFDLARTRGHDCLITTTHTLPRETLVDHRARMPASPNYSMIPARLAAQRGAHRETMYNNVFGL
jgi:hypothetical protein